MRKVIPFVFLAFLLAGSLAGAQGLPRFDVSAGYTYEHAPAICYCDIKGWNGSVAFNLNKWIGVVGETDFLYQSTQNIPGDSQPSENAQTFLFGPRVSYRRLHRLQPFVQTLAGKVRVLQVGVSNSSWSYEIGGGIDIGLNKSGRIAIRPQAMFLDAPRDILNGRVGIFSIDLVYRFGGKLRAR